MKMKKKLSAISAFAVLFLMAGCSHQNNNANQQTNISSLGNSANNGNTTVTTPVDYGKVLDLSGQGLSSLPSYVLDRGELEELDLSDNKLTGALPAEIRFLKRLKKLEMSNNQMTGIPAEIGQLSELEEINYSNNEITGLPLEIGNLKKLRILNLSGNDFSESDMLKIKESLPDLVVIGE